MRCGPLKDLCQGRGRGGLDGIRVCTRERAGGLREDWMKKGREREASTSVNIPPRVPHFLGTGLAGS